MNFSALRNRAQKGPRLFFRPRLGLRALSRALRKRYDISMRKLKRIFTAPLGSLFAASAPQTLGGGSVKLQKRCIWLSGRERDFVNAHADKVSPNELKALFLSKARGSIFSAPGSITHAVYH